MEFVTYSVEEPCFTSSLPQILRLFGFKYASLKCPNTCWGGYTAPYGGELVNWTAPDGTSILTSPRYACEELQPNSVWQTTAWGNETPYIEACIRQDIAHPVGMCYQDAGWRYGPWIGSGDSIRNNSIYVTWREYFERISEGRTTDDYRFPQEDMHVSLMWGSQVMQRIAREVRRAENSLSTAEKMGAIANLSNGYLYKQGDMDEAWRTLMLAQHHDSWIVPYNGLHGKGTWADHIHRWTAATDSICAGIVAAAEGSLAAAGNGRKEFGIRVCNTLGTPRREVVRAALPEGFDAEGAVVRDIRGKKVGSVLTTSDGTKSLLFEAEVPAFGYTTYTVREGRPQKGAQTAPHAATEGRIVVENDMYRRTRRHSHEPRGQAPRRQGICRRRQRLRAGRTAGPLLRGGALPLLDRNAGRGLGPLRQRPGEAHPHPRRHRIAPLHRDDHAPQGRPQDRLRPADRLETHRRIRPEGRLQQEPPRLLRQPLQAQRLLPGGARRPRTL